MKVSNRWCLTVFLLMMSLIAGCASVPMMSIDDDVKAKSFAVPTNKSSIYLYRNESFGSASRLTVALDGKVVGQTGSKTYFLWEVDPGPHEVSSYFVDDSTYRSTLKLNTDAGKAYFIWQEVTSLLSLIPLLQEVNDEMGRKGVAECNRAQSNLNF